PGQSRLMYIDLSDNADCLGGSALAQTLGQLDNEVPDVGDPYLLDNGFRAIQSLIGEDLILAGHDRSDGGLITTLTEMAISGNCGLDIELPAIGPGTVMQQLFSEGLGVVFEYLPKYESYIHDILRKHNLFYFPLGRTTTDRKMIIRSSGETVLDIPTWTLLKWWEATSDRLEQEQMNYDLAIEQANSHARENPPYALSFVPPMELSRKQLLSLGDQKPKVAIIREEGSNGDREMASAFYTEGFESWDVSMQHLLDGKVTLEQFRGVVFVGGFSYADVLGSAKGWAAVIRFNPKLKEMFDRFYRRPDTFSLGVCNGCQLMALLGWVPGPELGIAEAEQPRFIQNKSERFESRWSTVRIEDSPAIMLRGMAGSTMGIWVAHGEGRFYCPKPDTLAGLREQGLVAMSYVDADGQPTLSYPANPNGSPFGITGICSPDGRHLAMMPHPERVFRLWQWPWMPEEWKTSVPSSPWLRMFQSARVWCEENNINP
ncbi:phosphoribosylformylglycinamidine synthase subunit PurQ, partial [Patescibacteria group bacterium]